MEKVREGGRRKQVEMKEGGIKVYKGGRGEGGIEGGIDGRTDAPINKIQFIITQIREMKERAF